MTERGMPPVTITDVQTILTAPGGRAATVVKVLTDQPGLYGVGCASLGSRPLEVAEKARAFMEEGFRYIRVQLAVPGYTTYGSRGNDRKRALNPAQEHTWEPSAYARMLPGFIEQMRVALGEEVELLHDVHEHVPPILGVWLAKAVEPYRLFFLEDLFAPEDIGYFPMVRAQCATPLAMGELFVNQAEYLDLVRERLIDFIRCHISDIGGLTPARKLATFGELVGVRTAWHGASVSPVGHVAQLHLDMAVSNFGIQE